MRMHNDYAVQYNELVFGLLEKRFGKHEAVVFARSSAAGGQRFPVVRFEIQSCMLCLRIVLGSTGAGTANLLSRLWLKQFVARSA